MTESFPPQYRTGTLWGILTLFLVIGTVAAASVVYGLTDLFATGRYFLDVPIMAVGALVASLALLFIAGILYRVDRLRGVPHKRVRMFD